MNTFDIQVENEVKSVKGCQIAHIEYVSEPSLNNSQKLAIAMMSGNSEIVPIEKIASGEFQINFSYENAVNNRGTKEQGEPINFVAQSLRWGKWVEGQENKLIEHKGEKYLRLYRMKNVKVNYEYYVGGKPATVAQIAFIEACTKKDDVKTQTEAGLTENQVVCRSVKISNILAMTTNGKKFVREEHERKTA